MYVAVTPAIRSIRGVDTFTYHLPDTTPPLQVGALVKIPWRTQTIVGVVQALNLPPPKFRTKTIIAPIGITLPPEYLAFIDWFASYYYISKSHALTMALPDIPKRSAP